jgi:hypothetical protein
MATLTLQQVSGYNAYCISNLLMTPVLTLQNVSGHCALLCLKSADNICCLLLRM